MNAVELGWFSGWPGNKNHVYRVTFWRDDTRNQGTVDQATWSNPLIGSAYHMELRHLRYFTAVVQWKGYREASRHLHITQPSISEAISDLESELGIKLFSRDGRVARLTPEGQVFYEEAIKTLAQAERSIATAQRAAKGEIGRLGIGFIEIGRAHV